MFWKSEDLKKMGISGYDVVADTIGEYLLKKYKVSKDTNDYSLIPCTTQFIIDVECSNAGRSLDFYEILSGPYWEKDGSVLCSGSFMGDWWEGGDVTLHGFIDFDKAYSLAEYEGIEKDFEYYFKEG